MLRCDVRAFAGGLVPVRSLRRDPQHDALPDEGAPETTAHADAQPHTRARAAHLHCWCTGGERSGERGRRFASPAAVQAPEHTWGTPGISGGVAADDYVKATFTSKLGDGAYMQARRWRDSTLGRCSHSRRAVYSLVQTGRSHLNLRAGGLVMGRAALLQRACCPGAGPHLRRKLACHSCTGSGPGDCAHICAGTGLRLAQAGAAAPPRPPSRIAAWRRPASAGLAS